MLAMGCSSKKPLVSTMVRTSGSATKSLGGTGDKAFRGHSRWKRERSADEIHFAYNEYTIEAQDGSVLRPTRAGCKTNAQTGFRFEGHCDERGSEEYNIALGQNARRQRGLPRNARYPGSRISTRYGKELPPRARITTRAAGRRTGAITSRSASKRASAIKIRDCNYELVNRAAAIAFAFALEDAVRRVAICSNSIRTSLRCGGMIASDRQQMTALATADSASER